MKILILGGTGRTGIWTLREALERGHEVHALVRNPAKVSVTAPKLKLFTGTPTDPVALEAAMAGCEAVISCLNISRTSDWPWAKLRTPKDFLSNVATNVVQAATKLNIRRVVIISAAGVGDSEPMLPGWFHWLIRNSNIRYSYAGHEQQERILANSSLDWTLVRPVGLTNSTKDKETIVSMDGEPRPGMTVSRRNTAKFLLDLVEQGSYVGQYPMVSEK